MTETASQRAPTIEVAGRSVLALNAAMRLMESRARSILEQNGLQDVVPEGWYPMGGLLGAFETVLKKIGPMTLRAVGKEIPRHAAFPPAIDNIEKALRSIDVAYRMNHRDVGSRGAGAIGGYLVAEMEARKALMVCDNPYPCDMDIGLLESVADKFRPKDSLAVNIEHEGAECRKKGSPACTYRLTW